MGSEQSVSQTRFHTRYAFVQPLQDRNFGLVKIYRKRELNFDYVMVFDRHYAAAQLEPVRQQIERIKAGYTLQQEPIFLKILNAELVQGSSCSPSSLRLYLEYLNFTLRDAINSRIQAKQPFSADQIMYVILTALQAYRFLRNLNANYLTVRPDAIYLNPDGILRFSPVRADSIPIEPGPCDCIGQSKEVHFEKSERQFLIELKSTVLDLVEICPQNDLNFRRNYELLGAVNHARTLQQLSGCLWKTDVDTLLLSKKMETTQVSSVANEAQLGLSYAKSNKMSLRDSGNKPE